jgi:hypothetical protein
VLVAAFLLAGTLLAPWLGGNAGTASLVTGTLPHSGRKVLLLLQLLLFLFCGFCFCVKLGICNVRAVT